MASTAHVGRAYRFGLNRAQGVSPWDAGWSLAKLPWTTGPKEWGEVSRALAGLTVESIGDDRLKRFLSRPEGEKERMPPIVGRTNHSAV